jgi:hypothetical protein
MVAHLPGCAGGDTKVPVGLEKEGNRGERRMYVYNNDFACADITTVVTALVWLISDYLHLKQSRCLVKKLLDLYSPGRCYRYARALM